MNFIGQAISSLLKDPTPSETKFKKVPMSGDEKLQFLNKQKLGHNTLLEVPNFQNPGEGASRPLLHLDYTASAQGLKFIEDYIQNMMIFYANTHTETSETGRVSTAVFEKSINIIRNHVNAGPESFVIPVGYGATGAIERMQKILGVYLAPKSKNMIETDFKRSRESSKYVVFVGPYEHHSNDVSWQDNTICEFVRIKSMKGSECFTEIDFEDLESQLKKYKNYIKIGCFSAASNVTGIKTDVKRLGDLLKKYDAYYFLDYAAAGPYVKIDMQGDNIDAIFLSAHKNLGGTNLGILVGKNSTYDTTVSPTFGGGGTVQAVTPWSYHFHENIEEREYSGTPAIRQTWQAALSFQLKEWLGYDVLHEAEENLIDDFMDTFKNNFNLEVLGNKNPRKRIGIFSFLVKHGDRVIHHNLVAALLNDLFGIQARSGCACAGPFGHELLSIDKNISDKFVNLILDVKNGFKPGWTRIGSHYTLTKVDSDFIFKALKAVSIFGPFYINDYKFSPTSGEWAVPFFEKPKVSFGIFDLFENFGDQGIKKSKPYSREKLYEKSMCEFIDTTADKIVEAVKMKFSTTNLNPDFLKNKISQTLVRSWPDFEEFKSYFTSGLEQKTQSSLDLTLDSYFKPNESSPFSSLDQVDETVRFFYAPKDFELESQDEYLNKDEPFTCPNKS